MQLQTITANQQLLSARRTNTSTTSIRKRSGWSIESLVALVLHTIPTRELCLNDFIAGTGQICFASAEAAKLIAEGKTKYEAGDRMSALRCWETAMDKDPTTEQQQIALFNQTCVHAGFGDVETAQIMLRGAVQQGLDFKTAVERPLEIDPQIVKLQASQQVLIKLRKFSEATVKAAATNAMAASASSSSRNKKNIYNSDLSDVSEMLDTDMEGIDTSLTGIVKRVAILLVLLIGLGFGLFYFGLQYMMV